MRWHWGKQAPEVDPPTASPTPTPSPTPSPNPSPMTAAPASTTPRPDAAPAFIGRVGEQDVFRELLKQVSTGQSAFVHMSGTARTGRRALLGQFRTVATEAGVRCGPLIDFEADAGLELDELLERVAGGLEPSPDHFKGFLEATRRFRSKEAGQPTRTAQALAAVRAGSSVVTQLAGAFPVKAINTVVQSPLGDVLTEHAETKRTLSTVSDEFVKGLLELAQSKAPVVLVFGDLDFAPSSAKLLWLRRSLFPRIAHARVIVAVSSEPRFELDDVGMLFGRMEQLRLERFSPAEAEEFLIRMIGLDKNSPLGRAVLEDADCFPERLAGYAQYFDEHPDERETDTLPTQARDLTAGGLASGLLSRIQEPFLRDVLLHAAPLRWFNAELLDAIEDVCGLVRDGDAPRAASLLDLGMRPSWVTNVGGGWGIDVENRRRAIVDEFRRLHPGLYRRVHLHAAEHHVSRLRELEAALLHGEEATPAHDAPAFDYEPITHPTDRLRWAEYQTSLGEWLYHLVALSPRRGFACMADHVGEAMAWGYPEVATRLLDLGVEVALPASEVLARQRLLEVARAMHNNRHAETLHCLTSSPPPGRRA